MPPRCHHQCIGKVSRASVDGGGRFVVSLGITNRMSWERLFCNFTIISSPIKSTFIRYIIANRWRTIYPQLAKNSSDINSDIVLGCRRPPIWPLACNNVSSWHASSLTLTVHQLIISTSLILPTYMQKGYKLLVDTQYITRSIVRSYGYLQGGRGEVTILSGECSFPIIYPQLNPQLGNVDVWDQYFTALHYFITIYSLGYWLEGEVCKLGHRR